MSAKTLRALKKIAAGYEAKGVVAPGYWDAWKDIFSGREAGTHKPLTPSRVARDYAGGVAIATPIVAGPALGAAAAGVGGAALGTLGGGTIAAAGPTQEIHGRSPEERNAEKSGRAAMEAEQDLKYRRYYMGFLAAPKQPTQSKTR